MSYLNFAPGCYAGYDAWKLASPDDERDRYACEPYDEDAPACGACGDTGVETVELDGRAVLCPCSAGVTLGDLEELDAMELRT